MMKIRDIKAYGLRGGTPKGGWTAELNPEDCVHTIVTVQTDEGVCGIGSAFSNDQLVKAALAVLEPLYKGENALEPERVSEKLHQNTFWLGRGGTITHTISGIDVALWDILGKVTGQPIGRLLGGRYRDRVRPYASLLAEEPALLADKISRLKDLGWRAFKIGWGPIGRIDSATDEAIVKAARSAAGDGCQIMVDAGGSDAFWPNGLKWALRTSQMLASYNVFWFEEALKPDAIAEYSVLRAQSPVPIAGGEVLTRRQAFIPFLQAHAFDIVQPDVTKVGGISEERRIAWLAEEHGARLIPHGWNTAIGLASDLQLASAFSDTDLIEYIEGSPYVDDIVAKAWHLDDDGMLSIPEDPGLGLHFNLDNLVRYTNDAALKNVL